MSKWLQLAQQDRLFYTLEDLAESFDLPLPSARVMASRKSASGDLLRIRRDIYVLPQRFRQFSREDFFTLANILQTPSYISFLSALSYHHLTTQLASAVIESANPVRSRLFEAGPIAFRYLFCRERYFFGYKKENGMFIAEPEKALMDALYFQSLRRYALDEAALDITTLNWKKLEQWSKRYPRPFQTYLRHWRGKWKT